MIGCPDVERLFHPYLDGELLSDDCALVEQHLADCEGCRELVSYEARFKADLRARLRSRPNAGPPERLVASLRAALDQADARGEGPAPSLVAHWRRQGVIPASLGLVAAAAMVVFFATRSSHADSAIVEEAIRGHEKNLPVEVGGPNVSDDEIRAWMMGKVGVPVRPPLRVHPASQPGSAGAGALPAVMQVSLVGARVYHLRNRDVGQVVYRIGRSQMTVYIFDPSGWEFSAPVVRLVGQHQVYLAEERGYTVAFYRDRGIGYALASDLDPGDVMRLVASSLNE